MSPISRIMSESTVSVFHFIRQYLAEHKGVSPSQREIAQGCFISQSTVGHHLELLEVQGWIHRVPGVSRSISLTDKGKTEIPIK